MRLDKITPSLSKKNSFELTFENGERLVCSAAAAADFSLYAEKELTEDELARLREACKLSAAKEKAAELLGYRAMSSGELVRKLTEKGFPQETAEEAAQWLMRLGALDELEYAKSVVRHYNAKGWGSGRIREEFFRRRIPKEYWEEALEELSGENEKILTLLNKRLAQRGNTPEERKKAAAAMYRRGFSWEEINSAMAQISNESFEE